MKRCMWIAVQNIYPVGTEANESTWMLNTRVVKLTKAQIFLRRDMFWSKVRIHKISIMLPIEL